MSWRDFGDWWIDELENDPAYEAVITPLILEALSQKPGKTYLELGSGDGRLLGSIVAGGARAFGVDISEDLARRSPYPTVVGDAIDLPIGDKSVDGVYIVLMLEHVDDHVRVFAEAARVTRPDGVMALVCNHPIWTAPDSTPITDSDDEVLWRPGDYFSAGSSRVSVGGHEVTFHHRTMASLLNAAADAGWSLDLIVEQPHHEMNDQAGIPRLLACRWSLLP